MRRDLGALALACIAALPAAAETAATDTALAEARSLVDQGRPAEAVARLSPLDDGTDPRVGQLLGVAHYHANDHVRAIERLSAVVDRLEPLSLERREAVQVLGLASYLAGRIAEAVPFLEQTREALPDNAELGYILGLAYAQTRQPERARHAWARTFGTDPDSAAGHLLAARLLLRLEFDAQADAELKQALARDPKLPVAHFLLAQTALFRGRVDEGIALLERELALNPADSMAYYRLGEALTRQAQWERAIAALQKSIWLNPHYSAPYIVLGRAYMRKAQPGSAEGMLRKAIELDPNNKAAHYLLGQVLQQTGRLEEAKGEFAIAERLQGEPERR
jgi:tetratricopeptide (TPR) repeat protein